MDLKEIEAFLDGIHGLIVGYRKRNGIDKGRFATDAGLEKNSLISVEDKKFTASGDRSTITLMTLVKILIHYPDLRLEIADYLSGNTDKNITGDIESAASQDITYKAALDAILKRDKKIEDLESQLIEFTDKNKNKA